MKTLPEWPSEIPQHCPKCQRQLDIRSDLEIGPGPAGRFIKKYAFILIFINLPCLLLVKTSASLTSDRSTAAAFVAILILPTILLHILVILMPTKMRTYCFRCKHTGYHKLPFKAPASMR